MELRLGESDGKIIRSREFIHFRSEMLHSLGNASEQTNALVLIIRSRDDGDAPSPEGKPIIRFTAISHFVSQGTTVTSLVEELQLAAVSPDVQIGDLLRKALLVARKLDVHDFQKWLEVELNGYPATSSTYPEYRYLHGTIMAAVPGRWIPVVFRRSDAAQLTQHYSRMPTARPIAELESLAQAHPDGVAIEYAPALGIKLMEAAGTPCPPTLHVPSHQLPGVVEIVKNTLLKWALQLEKDGIMGSGVSFSKAEKATAATVNYNVTNFHGSISNSAVLANSPAATQQVSFDTLNLNELSSTLQELRDSIASLGLTSEAQAELHADIQTICAQLESPRPKVRVIAEAGRSLRTILEGAAGSLVASGLVEKLGPFFVWLSGSIG